MAVQLYTSVSLNSKGQQSPTLSRNASVAVPSPVLRSLSNAAALRSTLSTSNPADFVDITFRCDSWDKVIAARLILLYDKAFLVTM